LKGIPSITPRGRERGGRRPRNTGIGDLHKDQWKKVSKGRGYGVKEAMVEGRGAPIARKKTRRRKEQRQ